MTAKIEGFRSRAELGLKAPRSRSNNITPGKGGCVVHWGGPKQPLSSFHLKCEQIWKSWQNYHMGKGWADIAYTTGFCNHGYVLAGRGYFTRTAAQGTSAGNQNWYAFVWVGGENNPITQLAFDALEWLIRDARQHGNAGMGVRGHTWFTGTSCPGSTLYRKARELNNTAITAPITKPAPKDPFTEWWETMDSKQQEALEAFAKQLVDRGGSNPGDSFAFQFYKFHDEERAKLNTLLNSLEYMGSSPKGFAEYGVTALRVLRIMGVELTPELRDKVKDPHNQPTAQDLGIPALHLTPAPEVAPDAE